MLVTHPPAVVWSPRPLLATPAVGGEGVRGDRAAPDTPVRRDRDTMMRRRSLFGNRAAHNLASAKGLGYQVIALHMIGPRSTREGFRDGSWFDDHAQGQRWPQLWRL